jgi:hypothetical protein
MHACPWRVFVMLIIIVIKRGISVSYYMNVLPPLKLIVDDSFAQVKGGMELAAFAAAAARARDRVANAGVWGDVGTYSGAKRTGFEARVVL